MPYKDPEEQRAFWRRRGKRRTESRRVEKYGPEAAGEDMRGRHGNHSRGAAHPRWTEGRHADPRGYMLLRVGAGHPLADPWGWALEHHVVWVAAGRTIEPGCDIHHRNEDKADNRIENLEKLSKSEHRRLHNLAQTKKGTP